MVGKAVVFCSVLGHLVGFLARDLGRLLANRPAPKLRQLNRSALVLDLSHP